ncbi:hypothetical protein [Oceanobacter kriegii]|uniref:hypothetical protein n=1 Tax=Oceanobacter kriegii TaxID=64972 RepID=UPI0004092DE7|nr:hypothetical protein [Oceanobacter kriegii]
MSIWVLPAEAARLYRFEVDGRIILKDHIPVEYTGMGYDVLNSSGMLLESVPPAPTPEELAEIKANESAAAARKTRMEQQQAEDLKLLRLYEKPADVERARQRKTEEINTYIALLRRRIDGLEEKLRSAQATAGRYTKDNLPVPEDIQGEVDEIVSAQNEFRRDIRDRQSEFGRITREYAEQYERLRILQVYPAGTLYEDVDFDRVDRAFQTR